MEKEYSVKLYDDSVVEFKLISKDVFDELLTHQGWVEYSDPFTYECSLVFTKAYTKGSEFIALKKIHSCPINRPKNQKAIRRFYPAKVLERTFHKSGRTICLNPCA
ncbi:MAG: hypothetical protein IIU46_03460 [Treponema sp.]|nr:hypothetical protein [Treponema sp.]